MEGSFISQTFEHCNYQNLTVVCSLVVHLPMWLLEVFIGGCLITSTRKIVYRLHDQVEDEDSKSYSTIYKKYV